MLTIQGLASLLKIKADAAAPTVWIYHEDESPRLSFVCRFIFTHFYNLNYKVTSDLASFENFNGIKISYSTRDVLGALWVQPAGLLSGKGVSEEGPGPRIKDGMFYLYTNSAGYHHDVFSAVFYFISRYEEWQHHKKDKHGRFEASESLLFKNKFHLKPVVDIWLRELQAELEKNFFTVKFPQAQFRVFSTIDVDNLFAFRSKGILRVMGATAKDLLKLDFLNLKTRALVLAGAKKDPFDIYEEVSAFCFNHKIPLIYFFLFRSGTSHDRTVKPGHRSFKDVFAAILRHKAILGVHPSYDTSTSPSILEAEVQKIREKSGQEIQFSRQHYLRFDIRSTPQLLMNSGIRADFSMGFASSCGFRAGTTIPFFYYDFGSESQKDLLMVPFCVMDGVYTVYHVSDAGKAYHSFMEVAEEVKKVKGIFISVFHERSFSDHLYPGYGSLYKKLHLDIKP
jgi:hypothetical protein